MCSSFSLTIHQSFSHLNPPPLSPFYFSHNLRSSAATSTSHQLWKPTTFHNCQIKQNCHIQTISRLLHDHHPRPVNITSKSPNSNRINHIQTKLTKSNCHTLQTTLKTTYKSLTTYWNHRNHTSTITIWLPLINIISTTLTNTTINIY